MSEKTVIITESEGKYQIQNNGMSDFALIGILESILFDLKSVSRQEAFVEQKPITSELQQSSQVSTEKTQEQNTPDLRTRISNAIKAIKGLGGEVETTDLTDLTDEELQSELNELTNQYIRLKKSKGAGK
jgi:hypothetical protein